MANAPVIEFSIIIHVSIAGDILERKNGKIKTKIKNILKLEGFAANSALVKLNEDAIDVIGYFQYIFPSGDEIYILIHRINPLSSSGSLYLWHFDESSLIRCYSFYY